MSKLSDIFKHSQITDLLSESDTELVLSCLDPATGSVTRVTVRADMAVLPDEALLSVSVEPESELPPTWAITPQGQEFDLRGVH